jgi:hypothetical protein
MLIDEIDVALKAEKVFSPYTDPFGTTAQDDLREQIALLEQCCPRYDVSNVVSVLVPKILDNLNPVTLARNAELVARRSALREIAHKAPMGPPWDHFYLEYRHNDLQRCGFLVRWDTGNRHYRCTLLCDCIEHGGIELVSDLFFITLGPDDQFGGYAFSETSEPMRLGVQKQAEVVRTVIELLNWDRRDVPTATRSQEKIGKPSRKKTRSTLKKSSPTIIKFELFLKENLSNAHRASNGEHTSPALHLVRGHYKNYGVDKPRFGDKPVLGVTFGRLWTRPHQAGNPGEGPAKAPNVLIKVGDLARAS